MSLPNRAFAVTNGKITYCSETDAGSDVLVMDADGSNKTQLTNDGLSCYPSIAPNGSKIMYWYTGGESLQTGIINPDGTSNQPGVVNGAYGFWLPDSTRLFFIDFSSGFQPKTANLDGSSQQSVDWAPGLEGSQSSLQFSNDSTKITYANPDDDRTSVYVADADGSNSSVVSDLPAGVAPNFSADGNTIYFIGSTDGESFSLYSVGIDGTNQTELHALPVTGLPVKLSISPSGTKLLYVAQGDTNSTFDVYTMNIDGSSQTQIIDEYDSENGVGVSGFGWSPDSQKLVFSGHGELDENYDIFTINSDGSELTNLTNTPDSSEPIVYTGQAWGAAPESESEDSADQDNIPDNIENSAPNNGDANNDGTPDSEQSNVSSLVDPVTGDYAVLEVSDECTVSSVSIDEEPSSHQDTNFNYPNGLMDFTLDCGTPGFTATVTQYYYGASGNFTVRKYNPNTNTYTTIDSASISNQTIGGQPTKVATYQVKDGSSLDLDNQEDGNIHDPTGLATATDSLADTGENANMYYLGGIVLIIGSGVLLKRHNKLL